MKCKSGRCYSPVACEGFGYCRELNMAKTFHNGKMTLALDDPLSGNNNGINEHHDDGKAILMACKKRRLELRNAA